MNQYVCEYAPPSIETYRTLRRDTGLSEKTISASEKGLANTLFAVQVLCDGAPVGMGRVIGDGGCFFQVVDIAVLKPHQGRGLGKLIMAEITKYLKLAVPESGYVSLIADGKAAALYAQYGFAETAPKSVGMAYRQGSREPN